MPPEQKQNDGERKLSVPQNSPGSPRRLSSKSATQLSTPQASPMQSSSVVKKKPSLTITTQTDRRTSSERPSNSFEKNSQQNGVDTTAKRSTAQKSEPEPVSSLPEELSSPILETPPPGYHETRKASLQILVPKSPRSSAPNMENSYDTSTESTPPEPMINQEPQPRKTSQPNEKEPIAAALSQPRTSSQSTPPEPVDTQLSQTRKKSQPSAEEPIAAALPEPTTPSQLTSMKPIATSTPKGRKPAQSTSPKSIATSTPRTKKPQPVTPPMLKKTTSKSSSAQNAQSPSPKPIATSTPKTKKPPPVTPPTLRLSTSKPSWTQNTQAPLITNGVGLKESMSRNQSTPANTLQVSSSKDMESGKTSPNKSPKSSALSLVPSPAHVSAVQLLEQGSPKMKASLPEENIPETDNNKQTEDFEWHGKASSAIPDSISSIPSPKMHLIDSSTDPSGKNSSLDTDPIYKTDDNIDSKLLEHEVGLLPTKSTDLEIDKSDVYMMQPFTLTVAGICDANEKNYFPLQEKIALLESKLIDLGLEYYKLQEEHRQTKCNRLTLDESIRSLELVARDQVVFENLKLNYTLVSSELNEAKKLIKELRAFGWDNLPQRLLTDCRRANDTVERITNERDAALHEHSAARNIANEALKQLNILKQALEEYKKLNDQLMEREQELKNNYDEAIKRLNEEWEEKLLLRHNRDKRRQQHLAFMLEEERGLVDNRFPKVLEDITFRANMVFEYPTLPACVDQATHVAGQELGLPHDPALDKNWHVSTKISKAISEQLLSTRSGSSEKFGLRSTGLFRHTIKNSEYVRLKSSTLEDEQIIQSDAPISGAERQAWMQYKAQLRNKYEGKLEENSRLRNQVKELEAELQEARARTSIEHQLEQRIQELTEENKTLVHHYLSEMVLRKKYLNMLEDLRGKIRVYCRVRALTSAEREKKSTVVVFTPDEYTVLVKVPRGLKVFQFNRVFGPERNQFGIFEDIANSVSSVLDGYNVSILAYGKGGSGKKNTLSGDRETSGLVPSICHRIFANFEDPLFKSKFNSDVALTMFDLTNDGQVLDLLVEHGECQEMELQTDNIGNISVGGVTKRSTSCAAEMLEMYSRGLARRRAVELNINTARSNLVTIMPTTITNKLTKTTSYGKFTIIALGNPEKLKHVSNSEANKEVQTTNDSLSALGDVITSLAMSQAEVPYSSSKLTTFLQDSLGGKAKTIMIAHVDPTEEHVTDILDTLNYASRLRTIINQSEKVNNSEHVEKLHMTTERLKHGEPVPC